tara:strand:- start:238 stop:444 length:207 start_codon:yes stop_codon:yes gene_type:complete
MLGKLNSYKSSEKFVKSLDEALSELKMLKRKLPSNLYSLSSVDERHLSLILSIIEDIEIPYKIGSLND